METAEKLSITLPGEMVRVIRTKVESGGYASNSEVIREAMRLLMDRERRQATLESAIDRGIGEIEAGQGMTTEEVRRSLLEGLGVKDDQSTP